MPYHGSLARLARLGYGTYGIRGVSECLYSRLATCGQFDHGLTSQSGSLRYKSEFLYLRLCRDSYLNYSACLSTETLPLPHSAAGSSAILPAGATGTVTHVTSATSTLTHSVLWLYTGTLPHSALGLSLLYVIQYRLQVFSHILHVYTLYVALSSSSMATISNTHHATALPTLRSMLQSSTFVRVSSAGRANINRTGISW